jgi:DNA-binding response OmpR family regulator
VSEPSQEFAIVIEPKPMLADMISDYLSRAGYAVAVSATHAGGAAQAKAHGKVDFAVAAVPAPGESHTGAYLEEARKINPLMRMVVMLSDPLASVAGAPLDAVQLIKPFSAEELDRAVALARMPAQSVS